MKDRIKLIRQYFDLSQNQFANKINKSVGLISSAENGRCGLSDKTIDDISRIFGINKDWLVKGEGDMFSPGNEKSKANRNDAYKRIRKVRKDNKLTQEQFAEKVGGSTVLVHMIESRQRIPSNDFLSRISSVFGISYNWLLTGEGEEEADIKPVDEELIKWLNMHTDVLNELRNRAGLN